MIIVCFIKLLPLGDHHNSMIHAKFQFPRLMHANSVPAIVSHNPRPAHTQSTASSPRKGKALSLKCWKPSQLKTDNTGPSNVWKTTLITSVSFSSVCPNILMQTSQLQLCVFIYRPSEQSPRDPSIEGELEFLCTWCLYVSLKYYGNDYVQRLSPHPHIVTLFEVL